MRIPPGMMYVHRFQAKKHFTPFHRKRKGNSFSIMLFVHWWRLALITIIKVVAIINTINISVVFRLTTNRGFSSRKDPPLSKHSSNSKNSKKSNSDKSSKKNKQSRSPSVVSASGSDMSMSSVSENDAASSLSSSSSSSGSSSSVPSILMSPDVRSSVRSSHHHHQLPSSPLNISSLHPHSSSRSSSHHHLRSGGEHRRERSEHDCRENSKSSRSRQLPLSSPPPLQSSPGLNIAGGILSRDSLSPNVQPAYHRHRTSSPSLGINNEELQQQQLAEQQRKSREIHKRTSHHHHHHHHRHSHSRNRTSRDCSESPSSIVRESKRSKIVS